MSLLGLNGAPLTRHLNMFPSFMEWRRPGLSSIVLHFNADGTCRAEGGTLEEILPIIASMPASPEGLLVMWSLASSIRVQIERDLLSDMAADAALNTDLETTPA